MLFYALWRFAGNDKTGGGTSRSFCFKRNTRKGEGTGCSEKRNSRSVRFEDLPFEEALAKAEEAEQPVCIYFTADRCQACLLLEKNVLNLDEVADYYNDHLSICG